nr:hypothetical protein [Luteimonas sp. BDR2-5]
MIATFLQRQIRVHPLELAVFLLKLAYPRQLGHVHAAVLRLPLVVGRHADTVLANQILDRKTAVGLLQDRHDLQLSESTLAH